MHHLFLSMKMVDGTRLDLLLDIVIATGHHIDVLPVLRLLFVQNFSDEKLHSMTEVCLTSPDRLVPGSACEQPASRQFCTGPGAHSQTP